MFFVNFFNLLWSQTLQEVSYMNTAPKMITVFEYIYRNSIESFYLKKLYMNTGLEIQQTFYEIYFGLLLKKSDFFLNCEMTYIDGLFKIL